MMGFERVGLRARLLVGAAAVVVAAPGAGKALAQEAKWQPWIEVGGAVGNDHSFGDVDMFIPVWQDQTSLLFGDLRGTFTTSPTQEGNFGLGYRTQVDPSWILGGYGYFDIQNSENDNLFYQATLGLEALSVDWDFRVNGYIPFNAGGQSVDNSNGHLEINGNTIGITTDREKPLYGFDGEVGWRLPIFPADGDMDVRAFIGGYFFTNSDVDTIAGPRGRLEVRLYDIDFLGMQSRLTINGEVQWDNPRGTQAFGGLELRIPLGAVTGTPGPKLSPLDRRMVDRVQRDVDIVTEDYQSDPNDVVVDELTVKTHTIVFASANGDPSGRGTKGDPVSLDNAVALAESLGRNAIIVVQGNDGPIEVSQPLQLASGQALLGGGSKVPLHDSGNSDVTVGFKVPGSRPTLVG
ncbi:MAG: inverse autotransporter beta domain-containing protein, partial [Dongiaceae bacterium]